MKDCTVNVELLISKIEKECYYELIIKMFFNSIHINIKRGIWPQVYKLETDV